MHSPDTHQESSEKKGFTTADTTPAHTPLETSRRNSECYQREGDSVSDEKDQVDGGLRAWLVLLGAWLCFANSWYATTFLLDCLSCQLVQLTAYLIGA